MTERKNDRRDEVEPPVELRLKRLLCRRTGEQIEPIEHKRCPYCFGSLADIETGQHESFCDYKEGVDPVHFGFPEEDKRFGES